MNSGGHGEESQRSFRGMSPIVAVRCVGIAEREGYFFRIMSPGSDDFRNEAPSEGGDLLKKGRMFPEKILDSPQGGGERGCACIRFVARGTTTSSGCQREKVCCARCRDGSRLVLSVR